MTDEPKRIAVTMSLYPEEYDWLLKHGRCKQCNHLESLHQSEGGESNVCLVGLGDCLCNHL